MRAVAEGLTLAGLRRLARWSLGCPRPAALGLAMGWMAVLWYLSSGHGRQAIKRIDLGVLLNNFAHAPAFGLLTYALLLTLPRRPDGWPVIDRAGALRVLLAALAYGAIDELHQAFVPGRVASITDWITDATGASCVLWLAAFLGDRAASEGGLWLRFAAGVAICLAAAGLATVA